ncbi:MAG: hypothetical protein N2C14_06980 [Planctomycetales bacterium]
MIADKTAHNQEIDDLLTALKGYSLPIVAIFPASNPRKPIILRDVYTQSQLLDALKKAGPSKSNAARTARKN